jgi:hypothetical protein
VAPTEGYLGKPRPLPLAALIRRSIGWYSYKSYIFPGQYMRHSGFLMILGTVSDSLQQADATFREQ